MTMNQPRRFHVVFFDSDLPVGAETLIDRDSSGQLHPLSFDEAQRLAVETIKTKGWGLLVAPDSQPGVSRQYDLVNLADRSHKAVLQIQAVRS